MNELKNVLLTGGAGFIGSAPFLSPLVSSFAWLPICNVQKDEESFHKLCKEELNLLFSYD